MSLAEDCLLMFLNDSSLELVFSILPIPRHTVDHTFDIIANARQL